VSTFGVFGHLADGNLHVQIVGPGADDERLDLLVLQCAASFRGSISAEHGIGRVKVDHLSLSKSPSTIGAMRAIKGALDPTGILNPGVLLASGERSVR
jgi:FAD/FMN-containing dehydrogenase